MKNKNLWKLLTNSALSLIMGISILPTTFAGQCSTKFSQNRSQQQPAPQQKTLPQRLHEEETCIFRQYHYSSTSLTTLLETYAGNRLEAIRDYITTMTRPMEPAALSELILLFIVRIDPNRTCQYALRSNGDILIQPPLTARQVISDVVSCIRGTYRSEHPGLFRLATARALMALLTLFFSTEQILIFGDRTNNDTCAFRISELLKPQPSIGRDIASWMTVD